MAGSGTMNGAQPDPDLGFDYVLPGQGFTLAHQKVELDLDFSQLVRGKTEITVYPKSPDLKLIYLNARQCNIKNVRVNGIAAKISHHDPCSQLQLHFDSTVHQHHILSKNISRSCELVPGANLSIHLPTDLKIQRVDLAEVHTQDGDTIKINHPGIGGTDASETTQGLADTTVAEWTPLTITMDFSSEHLAEAVQFVTGLPGSGKWPHAYTRGRVGGPSASPLFPCVDILQQRCSWDITITSPRTVGDALIQHSVEDPAERLLLQEKAQKESRPTHEMKEMIVICSGKLIDENIVKNDSSKKSFTFSCSQQLSAKQIGFAVGPWERVNLGAFREAEEIERLGDNAVDTYAYCLPGRTAEVRNTCLPVISAIDSFVPPSKYGAYCGSRFALCFVEEAAAETTTFAHTAICSSRLLYPEDIIDPAREVTRKLIFTLASQWSGVNIIPETPADSWAVVGIAMFMTDLFMKDLCGNNEYRYRMREQADRVCDLDRDRPSIHDSGNYLHIDPSTQDFLMLKAPVVLFVLDRRIAKTTGTSKMPTIISRLFGRSRMGDLTNDVLSTDGWQKWIERFSHFSIDDFMNQWVKGAGCPKFSAKQKFNKKKLVIEMQIKQTHSQVVLADLEPENFVRDVREDWEEVFAGELQPAFTGPMTIRIHEADGTPYEHIVQIKDLVTNIDIPYNTKYKRLKRSKEQRRNAPGRAPGEAADDDNEALVYCLGDTLQSEEDIRDWRIRDWTAEDEERMNAESYEWIRMDADFEWIARIELDLPGYMYASQLQQDRDIVSQMFALEKIALYSSEPLVSSILVRTLVDRRYFHGIRHRAAQALVKHATENNNSNFIGMFHLEKAFWTLYGTEDDDRLTRTNDFSDQQAYMIQCSIIEAFSKIRDANGHAPQKVKTFLRERLQFNENSNNDYSDAFYVANIMRSLTSTLLARTDRRIDDPNIQLDEVEQLEQLFEFEKSCLEEIDRFRRMDEWTSSYQNLYCRTALQCQAKLAEAGVGTFSPLHFMQYTRPGNYDMLRLDAYQILIQPAILEEPLIPVLKYIVNCMVVSPSPYIRQGIQEAFGRILAKRAMGIKQPRVENVSQELVVEDVVMEDTTEQRRLEADRRQNIDAALAALMKELSGHKELKEAISKAINYSQITLEDLSVMLDFARMLYPTENVARLTLALPRYWQMHRLGKGQFKFTHDGAVRQKTFVKWQPPKPAPAPEVRPGLQSRPTMKLKFTNKAATQVRSSSISTTTPTPPPLASSAVTASQPPQVPRLKLNFGRKPSSQL